MACFGVDIIRAYELSWLNQNGLPQIAVLELSKGFEEPELDNWKLKKFLEGISNDKIPQLQELEAKLDAFSTEEPAFANYIRKITCSPEFSSIGFFTGAVISQGLRFICQKTSQPYIGTLNLCYEQIDAFSADNISNLLSQLRNDTFTPSMFTKVVWEQLQKISNADCVLSLHFNRRGGISQQQIRSTTEQDWSNYACRSVLE